jgi:uncharacterized membrane protein (UPF0127 family)
MDKLVLLVLLALLCASCEKHSGTAAPLPGRQLQPPPLPTRAQPKLPTTKLWLGNQELISELAMTAESQQAGMMFRTNMAENEAMLFVFAGPHRAGFWMMNTILPLSAGYIDPDGILLEIHDLQPGNTNTVLAASDRIQFVLEVNQGWFQRHNISTGTLIRAQSGPLKQLGRR